MFEDISLNKTDVVLAVPVNSSILYQKKLRSLLKKSGIDVLDMITSPVLSGLGYCYNYKKVGMTLICDLERNSIDFAVIENENDVYDVKTVSYIDFSDNNLSNILGIKRNLINHFFEIINSCELIPSKINNILICCSNSNPLSKAIKETVTSLFVDSNLEVDEKKNSSLIGSSLVRDVLAGKEKDILLLDVISSSISVSIGSQSSIIMKKDTTLPARKSLMMNPVITDKKSPIEINLFEDAFSEKLCTLVIEGDFHKEKSDFLITLDINTRKGIEFKVNCSNGKEKKIII